jgi:hypothetical protein
LKRIARARVQVSMWEQEKMFKGFFGNREKDERGDNTPTPRSPFVEAIIATFIWIFAGLTAIWILLTALPWLLSAIEVIHR